MGLREKWLLAHSFWSKLFLSWVYWRESGHEQLKEWGSLPDDELVAIALFYGMDVGELGGCLDDFRVGNHSKANPFFWEASS